MRNYTSYLAIAAMMLFLGSCEDPAASPQVSTGKATAAAEKKVIVSSLPSYDLAIKAEYDEVTPFHAGCAFVRIGTLWGVIDSKGKRLTPLEYQDISRLGEDHLDVVKGGERSYFYIRTANGNQTIPYWSGGQHGVFSCRQQKLVISPAYKSVGGRNGAPFVVQSNSGRYGVVDGAGAEVVSCTQKQIKEYADGFAPVQVDGGKWGYLDAAGKLVIGAKFDEANSFSEGLAAVKVGTRWGYVNIIGEIAIAPQFESAGNFTGKRAVVDLGKKKGVIDDSGEIILAPGLYREIDAYKNGAFCALTTEGQRQLYTSDGKTFRCGLLAKVFEVNKVFVVSKALTGSNPRYGIVAANGKEIAPIEHEFACPTGTGKYIFRRDSRMGIMDNSGRVVLPPTFDRAIPGRDCPLIAVSVGAQWGLASDDGTLLIAPKYDDMMSPAGGLAAVRVDGRWGYVGPARP